ncbi:hypothetical protein N431DRAFT_454535 [Stipitochalara longipes BDJ]|nr:hypothetical protein N431DRAFT_454535 [Stipitochalara longipes BDJ]
MVDPISVLGAAAAAAQFGDGVAKVLLESIKLLKALKETPQRMEQQLNDVTKSIERILVFRNTILAPGSPVFIHLTSQQRKRIDEAMSDANVAMKNLHQSLESLFPQHTSTVNKTLKSLWKAVVSVTRKTFRKRFKE